MRYIENWQALKRLSWKAEPVARNLKDQLRSDPIFLCIDGETDREVNKKFITYGSRHLLLRRHTFGK